MSYGLLADSTDSLLGAWLRVESIYTVTPEGIRVAVFYTKLRSRLLAPLLDADQPPAPVELRRALGTVQRIIDDYVAQVRLGTAA